MENTVSAVSKKYSVWSLYPVPLFALLVVLLLSLFLFVPVTITLDGYSHLYGGQVLRLMLGGQPDVHSNFSYNSVLLPYWLDTLLLAALSTVVSNELALKLLIVLIGTALISSLYFCIDAANYRRPQRAQLLIVLLPFALNAFLTLGFYGFLIGSSLCIFVLGLVLRHGLSMPFRLQCAAACLLLAAYFSHPIPVIISFLFPGAYFTADAILHWRDGWGRSLTMLRRHAFDIWPWLPTACLLTWFYLRLAKVSAFPGEEPHADSIAFTLTERIDAMGRDAFLSISPTANVGTLFIALLTILFVGVLISTPNLLAKNQLRFTILTVLVVSTTVVSLIIPDQVGDGSLIVDRFLLYCAIFLVLLALTNSGFDARLLTLCSLVAALLVVGFAGEYFVASKRLAPEVDELRSAMERVPRHARILIMGYRQTPTFCSGLPLLQRTVPERHWAMVGALKNELIVLNDILPNTSFFPVKSLTSRYIGVLDEVSLSSDDLIGEQKRAAWFDILKSDSDADFVLSWGILRVPNCGNAIYPPFEEVLKTRYDMIFAKQGSSRVALWRKRG